MRRRIFSHGTSMRSPIRTRDWIATIPAPAEAGLELRRVGGAALRCWCISQTEESCGYWAEGGHHRGWRQWAPSRQVAHRCRYRLHLLRNIRPSWGQLGVQESERTQLGIPVAAHRHVQGPDLVLG